MTAKKKPAEHKETRGELAALKHALELSEESRTRMASDYANLERRLDQARAGAEAAAGAKWLAKLFPVMDNFYRASTHAPTIALDDEQTTLSEDAFQKIHKYFEGLRQIEKQLEEILKAAGLERVKTTGEHFDPKLHEAISYEPSELPAETIIDEIEGGWLLNGAVIKPAKVRVSKG